MGFLKYMLITLTVSINRRFLPYIDFCRDFKLVFASPFSNMDGCFGESRYHMFTFDRIYLHQPMKKMVTLLVECRHRGTPRDNNTFILVFK